MLGEILRWVLAVAGVIVIFLCLTGSLTGPGTEELTAGLPSGQDGDTDG
jgi:hypothetical protein